MAGERNNTGVYSAIYSGVPVYEIVCNDVPIMRRMADSYMNATQILKVAGFSKPKRTKILETDVLQGLHQKIQGGYGKYQGTWIPLEAGKSLAEKYQVDDMLSPLLNFNPDTDFVGSKPPAIRRQSSKKGESITPLSKPAQLNIPDSDSKTIADTDFNLRITPTRSRVPSAATLNNSPKRISPANQEPTPQYPNDENDYSPPRYSSSIRLFDEDASQTGFLKSVRARRLPSPEGVAPDIDEYDFKPILDTPLILSTAEKKQKILMHIYIEEDDDVCNAIFFEYIRSIDEPLKFDMDLVLDDMGNTPLHWAAACGKVNLVRLLLKKGADPLSLANNDETALMRAVKFSSNYHNQCMGELIALLESSLLNVDANGETVLHHIAQLSNFRSKRSISHYYMRCISEYIENNRLSANPKFQDFLDAQNQIGDTALHIACRYTNHLIVAMLLEFGASRDIANNEEETATSLSLYDMRLRKVMHEYHTQFMDSDAYSDAPTTPMSEVSLDWDAGSNTPPSTSVLNIPSQLARKVSSSTLSSVSAFDHLAKISDAQVHKTFQHIGLAKSSINELNFHKERFNLIQKHAGKIERALAAGTPSKPISRPDTLETPDTPNKRVKLEKNPKHAMAETRLSSQLIRLESLVNASQDEQQELLRTIEYLKQERLAKDKKYLQLIANCCNMKEEQMNEMLQKCAD
ncbi:hypothetical protein HDV06_005155 [Boothiomyces sp. JEL0866]|nr:hypothetical protein HDV06_005155 [Boothiomyces sp. JEL0866]